MQQLRRASSSELQSLASFSQPESPCVLDATPTFPGTAPQSPSAGISRYIDTPPTRLAALDRLEASGPSGIFHPKTEDDPEKYDDYFREICSGYKKNINHMMVEPMICQPTPKGLTLLVKDFVERTGHDLRVEDQQHSSDPQDNMIRRFESFSKTVPADVFHQPGPVGVILTLGQHHACPVLFVRENDVNHVLIFDSTSGSFTKPYREVGKFFPDCKVLLNNGTRQVDSQSCITDAYEILCRVFTVDDLIGKVTARIIDEKAAPTHSRLRITSPSSEVRNFHLFRMPEELCFTAQRTEFVIKTSAADLQLRIKDGKGRMMTLENFLRSKKTVVIGNHCSRGLGINSYLHDVSLEHQERIKELVDRKLQQDDSPD